MHVIRQATSASEFYPHLHFSVVYHLKQIKQFLVEINRQGLVLNQP